MAPADTDRAHRAIHDYRTALDDAERAAKALASAARRAGEAAERLQPLVSSPLPAVEWRGAPPIAEWIAGRDALIADIKAALKA